MFGLILHTTITVTHEEILKMDIQLIGNGFHVLSVYFTEFRLFLTNSICEKGFKYRISIFGFKNQGGNVLEH